MKRVTLLLAAVVSLVGIIAFNKGVQSVVCSLMLSRSPLLGDHAPPAAPTQKNAVSGQLPYNRRPMKCKLNTRGSLQCWRFGALDHQPQHERYLTEEGGLGERIHPALILR